MCEDETLLDKGSEALITVWAVASKHWGRLLRPGTTFAVSIAAIYGIGRLLKDQELPERATWKAGAIANTSLTIVGVAFIATSVLVALGYRRALEKKREETDFAAACRDVWRIVQGATGIPPENLAVHAWTVTGFPGGRYLVRRTRFMTADRPPSPVKWRKGKGAIGKCWATGEESVEDLERFDGLHKKSFCAQSPEERMRLSWTDYQHTKSYRAIWVTPIYKGPQGARRVGGCLSIDVVDYPKAAEALDRATANNRELKNVLAVCDAALS